MLRRIKMSKKKISKKKEIKNLQKRFGTSMNWIEVTLPMTFSEVTEYFGKECDEFDYSCICCLGWNEWHKTHKVTIQLERSEIINLIFK